MAKTGKTAKLIFLGTGTSTGVPVPGCSCRVCRSTDPHDKRLRASVLISRGGRNLVIDTGPEFRIQCIREGVKRLDAVLITHDHADHLHGFDDVRPYSSFRDRTLPVWAAPDVLHTIRQRFDYIWNAKQIGGGLPDVQLNPVSGVFQVLGMDVTPIPVKHGKLDILGYRIGDLAYLTDVSSIPETSMPLLRDLGTLVINCVRRRFHRTHLNITGVRRLLAVLQPRRAWLTHLTHYLSHRELIAEFPLGVNPAHDGLQIDIALG